MKRNFRILPLLALLGFLAGCESTSFSDRLESTPPQVKTVDGAMQDVHLAAQKAFKRLDFALIRTTMGRIEAASAIKTSETFGDSRQTVARVRITQMDGGKCEVALTVTEEVGSSSLGGSRRQDLREHSLFAIYFASLQQVLQEAVAEKPAEKK